MKSYYRFLSRNKLYTAIEVVGLSIALAFVILLSSYIVDDLSCDKEIKDKERICLAHVFEAPMLPDQFMETALSLPEVESVCWYAQSRGKVMFNNMIQASSDDGDEYVDAAAVSDEFFNVFSLPLLHGDPLKVFSRVNGAVISERLAKRLYPNGDAMGRSLKLSDNHVVDMNLVITGIYKDLGKSIFKQNDVLFSHRDYSALPIYNNSEQASICLLKLSDGVNHTDVGAAFTNEIKEQYRAIFGDAIDGFTIQTVAFDEIRDQNHEIYSTFFDNIRKNNMLRIYMIMCIFIIIIALLDYIVLTMAFSRFRIKEIATRRLLGTERKDVIVRCIVESLFLLAVSCISGVCVAFVMREQVGMILGVDLHLFAQIGEYIIMIAVIALMAVAASSVPSVIISSYKPLDVIKGKIRYQDKMIYSKIFIGISGALSIIGLAVCIGISLQTHYMISQNLGYDTDNILYVRFNTYNDQKNRMINKYVDELRSESYIESVGLIGGPPMYEHGTWSRHCRSTDGASSWLYTLSGDRAAFDILGIKETMDFGNHSDLDIYLCESSYKTNASFVSDNMMEFLDGKKAICGQCTDFRVGYLKDFDSTQRLTGIQIHRDEYWLASLHPLVKVNIDEKQACRQIRKFYADKGYDEALVTVKTLNDMLLEPFREESNIQKLMMIFALISLLMTSMTIVGLSSYYAKTTEGDIAVRKVFGSTDWQIFKDTVYNFSIPVLVSVVAAIPVSWLYLDRWLSGYAYRIENLPMIYVTATLIVLLVVAISIAVQSLRLMRTNPVEALKKE